MKEAQRLAMEDALSRAEILAKASGVEVGKPIVSKSYLTVDL
jgi:uncharacterized protein YggE